MKETVEIISLLIGFTIIPLIAAFIYFRFAPNFLLNLEPRWKGSNNNLLIVRIIVENAALIRIMNPEITLRLALFDSSYPSSLPHRLPKEIEEISNTAKYLVGPEIITSNNTKFYPKERIFWDKFYKIEDDVKIVQMSLTAQIKLGFWGRIVSRKTDDWFQTVSVVSVRPH